MRSSALQTDFVIPELAIEPDTGRAVHVGAVVRTPAGWLYDNVDRYIATARSICSDVGDGIRVAYDSRLTASQGTAGRYIVPAGIGRSIAATMAAAISAVVGSETTIVVFGPEFAEFSGDDEELRDLVAADIAGIVGTHYPIRGHGPIMTMMPYLTQIAGGVVLAGRPRTNRGDSHAAELMQERTSRAIGRAYRAFGQQLFPDSYNQPGQIVTDFPAWPYLVDAVAIEGGRAAFAVNPPLNEAEAAAAIQETVAIALIKLGLSVEPSEPTRAF